MHRQCGAILRRHLLGYDFGGIRCKDCAGKKGFDAGQSMKGRANVIASTGMPPEEDGAADADEGAGPPAPGPEAGAEPLAKK
eukprot:4718186-Pyramimonas_sp.AAC.1